MSAVEEIKAPGVTIEPEFKAEEVVDEWKTSVYQIEEPAVENRVEKFLKVFEVILEHTNYKAVLDMYARSSVKCGRCFLYMPGIPADPRSKGCSLLSYTHDPGYI